MAADFYSKFVTDRKRRKIQTIFIFSIFNCLQIRSQIRVLRHPTHLQKDPKTQKRRLQLNFATDFSQTSHKVASPYDTQLVIFSKPPTNILPPFLFLFQLYRVSTVPSLPYRKTGLIEFSSIAFYCFLAGPRKLLFDTSSRLNGEVALV